MSTGYLSRLESGARQPTARAVGYLAERLGLEPADFEEPTGGSLADVLSLAASGGQVDVQALEEALAAEGESMPVLRWQALWLLSEQPRNQGDHAAERVLLEQLVRLGDEVGLAPLRVRGLTRLARCLRALGEIVAALEAADRADRIAKSESLGVDDRAAVLLSLISAEAEARRLPDARRHSDELNELVAGRSDTVWAEAMWTAAGVRTRQGDFAGAHDFLEQALAGFRSTENPTLWLRLRLAATRMYLEKVPADTESAERTITAADAALAVVGTPGMRQEVAALKVDLAFITQRYDQARVLLDALALEESRMSYRDQVSLDIRRHQLRILSGDTSGVEGLRVLAEQAQADANVDLAAEIWRVLAEALTQLQQAAVAS
jgi:tetratricopeptide (TPR) repeat protein